MKKVVFSTLFVAALALGTYSVIAADGTPKKKKSCCTTKSADTTAGKGCCHGKTK